jgi:HEAT repeat protein
MLESHQPHANLAPVRPPKVDLAKFPPDDSDLPDSPPGGGIPAGGGYNIGDGDFKKGRFSIWAIIVGILAVAGIVVFLIIGVKQDEERVGVEDAEKIKKAIYVKPQAEQTAEWRKWGATGRSDYLKQEALKQLAWAKDPEGVGLCIKALKDLSEPVQAQGATCLAEYASPLADPAKSALLAALKTAGPACRPQIAWALVELGEASAFNDIMALYRAGHLSKVQKLNGVVAFDPDKIVRLVSLDQLAQFAGDPSESVRQLVATVLSRHAEPKFTDALIKLVQDKVSEVARQAAPGLGKIGDERSRDPLLKALKTSDKDSRKKFLEALRDGIGTKGLVMALDSVSDDRNLGWFQTQQIFDMIEGSIALNMIGLNDPRGGDSLATFIEKKPHIHWQTRAAFALAKVGDLRGVPTLAKRLRMDPLKIYSDDTDFEMALKRDDNERVVASRMIADLAQMYPDKAEQLREQAEDALIFWIHELPSPHANGLRALSAMG